MAVSSGPDPDRAVGHPAEHRTVSRVMTILELVVSSEPEGMRLADLAEAIGAPKSSIHGLTRGLVATGYLRDENGRYLQGAALAGLLSTGGEQVPATFHRALEALSRQWNETAVLATVAGESVINIDVVESKHVVRATPPLRQRRPMWPNSYGKCFLTFMEPQRRNAYLSRNHKDRAELARILAEIEQIREERVGYSRGESSPDMFGVASPIFSAGGTTVNFCIGLAIPIGRMPADLTEISASVRAAAEELSFNGSQR